MNYSVTGDNELRLYDFLGIYIFYKYFKYFKTINHELSKVLFFRRFRYFAIYCTVSIIFTFIFSIALGRILWTLQSLLYIYHLWVFFLGSVFLYYHLKDSQRYNRFIGFFMLLLILEAFLVILQNLEIAPFLWNDIYREAYLGFLSGTLGPNKIVLGMTMFMGIVLAIGILFQKLSPRVTVLAYLALVTASIVVLLSGSRTSYVAILIFLFYFFIKQTKRFVSFAVFGVVLFFVLLLLFPNVIGKVDETVQGRVVDKIENPDDLQGITAFNDLYVDLGSGRDQLHLRYISYLVERPYIIPLGIGFNNRLIIGFSAHNIYLSLINEVGLFGLILYLRWLISYLLIAKRKLPYLQMALNGLVLAMMVTLYFGEHLYVYRPLFGLLGLFMMVCVLLLIPLKNTRERIS